MTSLRTDARIARSADDVWKVVSDAGSISTWFPAVAQSSATGSSRSCTLADGTDLEEDLVNVDGDLRRFQYRITSGVPADSHLGTVDVLEDGPDASRVVYSTEISPEELAGVMAPMIEQGLQGLKAHLEGGGA